MPMGPGPMGEAPARAVGPVARRMRSGHSERAHRPGASGLRGACPPVSPATPGAALLPPSRGCCGAFRSTPPIGSDSSSNGSSTCSGSSVPPFPPALPHGSDMWRRTAKVPARLCFDPRSFMGAIQPTGGMDVSIHAPAGGRPAVHPADRVRLIVSVRGPHGWRHRNGQLALRSLAVSIRTPAWERPAPRRRQARNGRSFDPRPRMGRQPAPGRVPVSVRAPPGEWFGGGRGVRFPGGSCPRSPSGGDDVRIMEAVRCGILGPRSRRGAAAGPRSPDWRGSCFHPGSAMGSCYP